MVPSLPFATLDQFMAFIIVLARLAGIFSAIPLFGGKGVPNRIKAIIILVMSLTLFPVISAKIPTLPTDSVSVITLVIRETLVGLSLSILSQIIFGAVEFCGQLVSIQTGLAIATQFDPMSGSQFATTAILQNLLAALLFMSLGVHHI